ncbi:hypothetical protein [Nostoc sp. PCC 9305]|uniref:hypothetical protein n=1 Tax=Nostoc sp. PCC 9305 TaxID=296636 RepID=UPI0039C72CB7
MKSHITAQFRQGFSDLPEQVQEQTREAYRLFKQDPSHPSLRFKKVQQNYQFIQHGLAKIIERLDS